MWWTPTTDGAGGLYVGVGNPLPWNGTRAQPNGAAYRGRALYTDSLLSLDLATGRVRWFDQVAPHDIRDHDFTLPPIIVSTRARELIVGGGKGGQVIAWDRARTGGSGRRPSASIATTPVHCPPGQSRSAPGCSAAC